MLTLSARNRTNAKIQATKIDNMLENIGLMRHVVPKDGNSLFRCISQCVFYTQSSHMIVRKHLLQFANFQTYEFSQMTHLSVRQYEKKIASSDGEFLDLRIAAKVYTINVAFYTDVHPFIPHIIKTPNAVRTLNICLNYEGTYDLVLIKESVVNMSFCQAIIYGILYNGVYKLSNVDYAVNEMLFDRNLKTLKINDKTSLDMRATCTDMKELLKIGITPFPFKVAKSLTYKLYRNTEYDIWLNKKKEKFYGNWNNWQFKQGSKCIVMIDNQEFQCYIQHISGKSAPVEVYVKELGQKMQVDYSQLKLLPVMKQDLENMTGSLTQVNQVSSTDVDGNTFICPFTKQYGTPVPYKNTGFIHRLPVNDILPRQVFPPCYVSQYQQHPSPLMTSIDTSNGRNSMYPWYIPNDSHPFKEHTVLLEPPFNKKEHIVSPSSKLMDSSVKKKESYIQQPMFNTSSICQLHKGSKKTNNDMDLNVYQPLIEQPGLDVPADESQQ